MHCREILFIPRCSPRAREFPSRINFFVPRTVAELRGVKVTQLSDLCLFSNTKPLKPSGDQPTAQALHRRMMPIFPCGSRRSKGVPSGTGDCLRLLVGQLGTPNLPKFSPVANGYIHAECCCMARQIWTKDV